jgi:hypothetical protein
VVETATEKGQRKNERMKKLIIVAAAAAMTGAAFADAQVYDAKLSVKTTACKSGKFSKALAKSTVWSNYFGYEKGDQVSYRKQASLTIQGVIWGCDCDTIADPRWRNYGVVARTGKSTVGGYAFWYAGNTAVPLQLPYVKFGWAVLNRIDDMSKIEGTWMLGDPVQGEALFFLGAGFGTVKNYNDDCDSYIKSIKGNFAGFIQGGDGGDNGCIFCGAEAYGCLVAPFCVCANPFDSTELSAAYGTWSIKYNSSASKKLKTKYYITQAESFSSKKLKPVEEALLAAYQAIAGVKLNGDKEEEFEDLDGSPTNEDAEIINLADLEDEYYAALYNLKEDDDVEAYKPAMADDLPEIATALLEMLEIEPEPVHEEAE